MNVLIAKTVDECEQWTDVAVVVDVLRAATTVCALLERGKKDVLVFGDAEQAVAFAKAHPDFEVYSELDLPVAHEDNSPYAASRSNARKPALVVTTAGTKAVTCARQASLVLAGGFCNFYALAEALTSQNKDVLLIPSALYGTSDDVEDGLCVQALKDFIQGIGTPEDAIVEFNNTMRYGEFMKQGPKTAEKDAKIAFKVNGLPVVPQITCAKEGYGVCHAYGTPAPAQWLDEPPAAAPAEVSAQEADEPAEEAVQEAETPRSATKRIKNFFSDILHAAKEEKAELEKSVQPAAAPEKTASAPQSDDLLDAVLKQSQPAASQTPRAAEPAPEQLAAPADKPAPAAQADAPREKAFGPRQSVTLPGEVTFSGKASGFGGKAKKKAIVLFSGGLDSTTCLYWAIAHGYECEALTVSYGQRHDREVLAAQMIARNLGIKHHLITLNLPWLSCCSLVDKNQTLPDVALEDIPKEGIPSTYVPGRNLMFLAIAGSLLDAAGADAIIAGPNAVDFSGYPDCTPAFFKAAADALNRGTKMGVTEGIEVLAPLMRLSKTQIVQLAAKLKVPFELTWSCYAGGQKPCGHCDSCKLRAKGFAEAGIHDTSLD